MEQENGYFQDKANSLSKLRQLFIIPSAWDKIRYIDIYILANDYIS